MATCLVTGGAGFIGSHLVEALLCQQYDVRVLDDCSTGLQVNLEGVQAQIQLFRGSTDDQALLESAVRGCDIVFHLAALPSVPRSVLDPLATHQACLSGTLVVLMAALQAGVRRVVYAASSSAYGALDNQARSEADPVAPRSPYAAAKLAGELYCQCFTACHGLETVRLRFFNIFGPRQRADSPYSGVIPLFIRAFMAAEPPTIHGDGLQSRDFTYVANAVDALVLAARSPAAVGNVYNIGTGKAVTLLDVIQHLNQLLGTNLTAQHTDPRPGDVRHSRADISRAERDLGYSPQISFVEGLRRMLPSR
jgi:UDP-glucose 4-epimerase